MFNPELFLKQRLSTRIANVEVLRPLERLSDETVFGIEISYCDCEMIVVLEWDATRKSILILVGLSILANPFDVEPQQGVGEVFPVGRGEVLIDIAKFGQRSYRNFLHAYFERAFTVACAELLSRPEADLGVNDRSIVAPLQLLAH